MNCRSNDKGVAMDFSLIVPCYNEAGNVGLFFKSACRCFEESEYTCEFIFVDDGSKDGTLEVIRQEIVEYRNKGGSKLSFKIVEFSRNFGKEAALFAGLEHAEGAYLGFIDADMQQDPVLSLRMLCMLINESEYDCIAAAQAHRKEGALYGAVKHSFYKIFNRMSETQLPENVSDFRVFTRQVADALLSMKEQYRFSKGLFSWVGFRTKIIPYEAQERFSGETKWSFRKLISYAWNGMLAFSTLPLKVIMVIGIVLAICSFVLLGFDIYKKVAFNSDISISMVLLYVVLLLSGIQMVILGVLGEYMARGYIESKGRPIYIARNTYIDAGTDVKRAIGRIEAAPIQSVSMPISSIPASTMLTTRASSFTSDSFAKASSVKVTQ